MAEQKFCPFGEGHLVPATFFNRDASRRTGLAPYCKRHASEKSHPERNRQLSGTCDECGQPARTTTCPDCLWAERMIQEPVFENLVRETESSFPAEPEDVDSSISAFSGLTGKMREGKKKFSWKTV